MLTELGKFLRDNFDKLLLFWIFIFCVAVTIHLAHDSKDADQILWAREMAQTVLGGLLGLITGHALAASRATSTSIPAPGTGAPLVSTTTESNPQ